MLNINQTLNSQKTSIPYLALVDVYREYFRRYWLCYNGATVTVLIFFIKNSYNDVFLLVFIEPNMWILDKGPSPAIADQSEGRASGEAEVLATPVSTSNATAY